MGKKNITRTLAETIYNYLKEGITSGKIKANQRIRETNIASYFNVSKTPVREAFTRLAGEGLITISSHKEVTVRKLSYKELMDIYYTMGCIDEIGIKLAFNQASDRMIKEIEKNLDNLKNLSKEKRIEAWLDADEKIFLKICELSGNEFLYQVRKMINAQLGRYRPMRVFLFAAPEAIKYLIHEFEVILEALRSKDKRRIENINIRGLLQLLPSNDDWIEYQKGKVE